MSGDLAIFRVGVDFDNTVAIYDRVFHRHGMRLFGMPTNIAADKPSIRTYFWGKPGGRDEWVRLQGAVYGERMGEAEIAVGLQAFLSQCRAHGVQVSIISHKTEFPNKGPQVSLHAAALRWLHEQGLLATEADGVDEHRVFFEPTRARKLARITEQGCALFIDDLPEVLSDARFPPQVERILYDPRRRHPALAGSTTCHGWEEISRIVQKLAKSARG